MPIGVSTAESNVENRRKGLLPTIFKRYADHPELRFDEANGLSLCRDCHMARHGRLRRLVEVQPCACGCGALIPQRDIHGRPRRFVNHHHARGVAKSDAVRAALGVARKGRSLSPEHRARIAIGLRMSDKRSAALQSRRDEDHSLSAVPRHRSDLSCRPTKRTTAADQKGGPAHAA